MLLILRFGRISVCGLLLSLFAPIQLSCWAENLKILVVLSENSPPYQSFANTLIKGLPPLMQTTVMDHSESLSSDISQPDLIVTVGMKAMKLVTAKTSAAVLAVMIPKLGYEEQLAKSSTKKITQSISAIYFDQPWSRQMNFLRAAFPDRRRIGLLHSQDAHIDVARLRQEVTQWGGSLVAQPVFSSDELSYKLESVLSSSDILLAIPDSMIYNSSSIRNVLLTSYRHSVPLIGFSQAYVNAGALCAIFSTPEQLAEQAMAAVILFAQTRQLPEPQYSAAFSIAVNQQVARSLGIALQSPEVIRNQINKAKEEGL